MDVERVLVSFHDIEVLPSKFLIYGASSGVEKFKQELASFSWMSQLPFLHLPKIEALEDGISIKAISFAGASEINPDISLHHGDLDIATVEKHHKLGRQMPEDHEDIGKHHANLRHPKKEELEDVGFVSGDIEEVSARPRGKQPVSAHEDFEDEGGYAVAQSSVPMRRQASHQDQDLMEYPENYPASKSSFAENIMSKALAPFVILGGGGSFLKMLFVPVILLLALGTAYILFSKATVTVYVDPRNLEKEATVIADPSVTQVDEVNRKIPGKVVDNQISGTSKATATGKKKIGDPAKGSVLVYNKTPASKTLSAGTVLTGSDNMSFKLDSSVTIASMSAVEGGISFGKTNANVTAEQIGPEGNLPAGKELSVKGVSNSDISAKVDTAFSGGVSKDVQVVTSDDQKKLLALLSSDLRKQAAEGIQGKITDGFKVLSDGLSEKIVKQTFSKNVNDQASEFSLNLTVEYKGTAYSDNDLKTIVSKLVETNVPEGYELDLSKTQTQADVSKINKDGTLEFSAKFVAKLMPKLDKEKVKKDVVFKTPAQVNEKLKSYENVIEAAVAIKPSLPGPLQRLPLLPNNIQVEITTK